MAVNEVEVQAFVEKAFGDIGGMLTAALVVIGDKLGLYRALAAGGAMTPAQLAKRTETTERYTAEIDRVTERQAASSPHQTGSENRWQDLTVRLRPIAGMESAGLIAAAAAYVAAADGVVHTGEIELLRSLRDVLGLEDASIEARL